MAIKLADTLAPMSEFHAVMAEHIGFSDGATLQEKFDNKELGGGDNSVTLTQEEYEALTEEEKLDGLYYTYDTKRIYKNGVQYGVSDAEDIGYNNAESGIQATTVQGVIDKVVEKVDGLISDTTSSTTSTWSSQKTSDEIGIIEKISQGSTPFTEVYSNGKTYNKLTVKCYYGRPQLFEVTSTNGYIGRIMVSMNGVELSATSVTVTSYQGTLPLEIKYGNSQSTGVSGYYSVDLYIYKKSGSITSYSIKPIQQGDLRYTTIYESTDFVTSDATEFESATETVTYRQIATLSDTTSSTTSTYSSAKINELNANRQVKTFDNTNSTTEKWYKICSAITGGIGCNIKLTASRADSTATVQYFSALYRDSRYRYTSSYISRERTVYESELVAEYSTHIIADANNDIWVHVPSYGKAIIEIDTRAVTIDGTVGTPVEDYVYNSFEHQYDGKINDSATNTDSTWSSSMIASQINNATAIKRSDVIAANTIKETGWNLAQGESHFYGRLLQLDGHLGSKSSTFSFLLFVKANYDNPTTVYVTQLAGMDDDRSNIAHTTYFELGVSSSGNLTIKNKSAVAASYRFI